MVRPSTTSRFGLGPGRVGGREANPLVGHRLEDPLKIVQSFTLQNGRSVLMPTADPKIDLRRGKHWGALVHFGSSGGLR